MRLGLDPGQEPRLKPSPARSRRACRFPPRPARSRGRACRRASRPRPSSTRSWTWSWTWSWTCRGPRPRPVGPRAVQTASTVQLSRSRSRSSVEVHVDVSTSTSGSGAGRAGQELDGDIGVGESGAPWAAGRSPSPFSSPSHPPAPPARRTVPRRIAAAVRAPARAVRAKPRPVRAPTLAEARAAMTSLMRDRSRRRFHHQWERAIRGLLQSARGKDAPAAYLEAARARYALYRWSANEADREAALELSARATRAGSRRSVSVRTRDPEGGGGAGGGADRRSARRAWSPRARCQARRRPRPRPSRRATTSRRPIPALEAALADLSPAAAPVPSARRLRRRRGPRASRRSGPGLPTTTPASPSTSRTGWGGRSSSSRRRRAPTPHRARPAPAVLEGAAVARPVAGEQVDRVRAAQNDPETVRVVLELPGADGVQVFALDDPPRLVLDIGARPHREPRRRRRASRASRDGRHR